MQSVVSSLDVLENYLAINRIDEIGRTPGRKIWELGKEMRRFAESYEPPSINEADHPIYVGGWPSANFWTIAGTPLICSSLLYSGQIVVRDPLIDWFSSERYSVSQLLGSRQGYLTDDGEPDVLSTRIFLGNAARDLLHLKPLVDSGALVLVPGERIFSRKDREIRQLRDKLNLAPNLKYEALTSQFDPEDLTVSDTRRGLFVFAGGERRTQLRKAVGRALTYFAREYIVAQEYGVEYAAPWRFEQYLCDHGIGSPRLQSESQRVIKVMWSSRLPIFSGLTPKVLSDVRTHDSFMSFRGSLFDAYRGLPTQATDEDYRRYVGEVESAKLAPILQDIERSSRQGLLSRTGVELIDLTLHMTTAFALNGGRDSIDALTPAQGASTYALGKIFPSKGPSNSLSIYRKLHGHSSVER